MNDPIVREWSESIQDAGRRSDKISLQGSGSHVRILGPPQAPVLSTRAYRGIIRHDPEELYVRVRAGTPVSELMAVLKEHQQMLSFEPPIWSSEGTVGGMIATGIAGPRRMASGPVRDSLLGVKVLDGRGRILEFGGSVIKNVAGYDASRIYAGSLGQLGLILEVVLRVQPCPDLSLTLTGHASIGDFMRVLAEVRRRPWPVDASAFLGEDAGQVWFRLQGSPTAVQSARSQLVSMLDLEPMAAEGAEVLWLNMATKSLQGLPDFEDPHQTLWRLSVPPQTPEFRGTGPSLIEWHGGLRWLWGVGWEQVALLSSQSGGWGSRFGWCPDASHCWPSTHGDPVVENLARRIKLTLDPDEVFLLHGEGIQA